MIDYVVEPELRWVFEADPAILRAVVRVLYCERPELFAPEFGVALVDAIRARVSAAHGRGHAGLPVGAARLGRQS